MEQVMEPNAQKQVMVLVPRALFERTYAHIRQSGTGARPFAEVEDLLVQLRQLQTAEVNVTPPATDNGETEA